MALVIDISSKAWVMGPKLSALQPSTLLFFFFLAGFDAKLRQSLTWGCKVDQHEAFES